MLQVIPMGGQMMRDCAASTASTQQSERSYGPAIQDPRQGSGPNSWDPSKCSPNDGDGRCGAGYVLLDDRVTVAVNSAPADPRSSSSRPADVVTFEAEVVDPRIVAAVDLEMTNQSLLEDRRAPRRHTAG